MTAYQSFTEHLSSLDPAKDVASSDENCTENVNEFCRSVGSYQKLFLHKKLHQENLPSKSLSKIPAVFVTSVYFAWLEIKLEVQNLKRDIDVLSEQLSNEMVPLVEFNECKKSHNEMTVKLSEAEDLFCDLRVKYSQLEKDWKKKTEINKKYDKLFRSAIKDDESENCAVRCSSDDQFKLNFVQNRSGFGAKAILKRSIDHQNQMFQKFRREKVRLIRHCTKSTGRETTSRLKYHINERKERLRESKRLFAKRIRTRIESFGRCEVENC